MPTWFSICLFILSCCVLALTLAIAALYRIVVSDKAGRTSGIIWPLPGLYIGDRLSVASSSSRRTTALPFEGNMLCVVSPKGIDCTAHLISAAIVSKEVQFSTGLLGLDLDQASFDQSEALKYIDEISRVWIDEMASLEARLSSPVTILISNNKLIDACADLLSPTMIRSQFQSSLDVLGNKVTAAGNVSSNPPREDTLRDVPA